MRTPLVSVVVPAYNQSAYLAEALASALAQTMGDLEVIVVDDGSTDDTRAVCESIEDPRLRYEYQANDGTMGLGARNRAMLLARGEWIALLDQDDRWSKEKLARQLAAADSQASVGAIFTRVRFIDAQGQPTGEQPGPLPQGDVFHLLLRANRYYASSGVFRRSLLSTMGLPHESVGIADWYLWASVARHARVLALGEVLTDYRLHPQGFQLAQKTASAYRFWHDHWSFAQAIAVRIPPECACCRLALRVLRRQIADQQVDVASNLLRQGLFSGPVIAALVCAWRAEPAWVLAPGKIVKRSIRLLRGAGVGLLCAIGLMR